MSRWRSSQECGALGERKGAADLCEHRDVRWCAEAINAQKVSTSGCGYHQTGWNQTQSVKTKSGPTFRNNSLSNKQKNRRIDACRGCTTAAKWVAGKTLEDERLKLNEELVMLQVHCAEYGEERSHGAWHANGSHRESQDLGVAQPTLGGGPPLPGGGDGRTSPASRGGATTGRRGTSTKGRSSEGWDSEAATGADLSEKA